MSGSPSDPDDTTQPLDADVIQSDPGETEPLVFGGRELRPGERIGAYVFERELGSGGMARVLLAKTPEGRRIALKVLRANRLETGLGRFRREFHALSRIDHPNVVHVEAYGDLHGHPYIAMEFVDGPDLHRVVRDFKNIDDVRRYARVREILIDICRALAAVHRRGLVHRDLKPSNVLLTRRGTAKLTDFGIVKDLESGASTELSTTLVGTWAYTSPEHICGLPIDHRSDLYSLGVILFAMLTGKRPFAAEGMSGYLVAHRDKIPPRASRVRPSVPHELDEICARLLEKAPRDRFQSANEILFRLEADDPHDNTADHGGWEPPLTGHRDALALVEESVAGLTAGRGGVVRVFGDDGSGKSRVMAAAITRARALGLPVHRYAFPEEGPAYGIALAFAKDLTRDLPEADALEINRLATAWSEGGALRGDTRYALYDLLKRALSKLLEDHPRVLLLDDAHAASPHEADLFRYLVRHLIGAAQLPLLLILAGRKVGEASNVAWTIAETTRDVTLNPLSQADVVSIVESLLGPSRATIKVAERLHAESNGNPYFVSEFLRSLMGQGLLSRRDNGWVLMVDPNDLAEGRLEIPPGIRQMLRSRLDRVTPQGRTVLDALAVAGRPTTFDALLFAVELEEESLLQRLDALIDTGLVRESRRTDDVTYEIVHAKLGDLLRLDLAPQRTVMLHRRLAEALEESGAQDPATLELIGEHFRHADQPARAYDHLVVAARRLVERSMPEEASKLARHATSMEAQARGMLDAKRFTALKLDLLRVTGATQENRGEWTGAAATWKEMLQLADDASDDRAGCDARIELAVTLRRLGETDRALTFAQEALVLARHLHYRKGVAEALLALAALAWDDGDIEQCESLADEGLLTTQGPALANERAQLLMVRSSAQGMRGQLTTAVHGLGEAEQIFTDLRMKTLHVLALANLSELHAWHGEAEEAYRRANDAVRTATDLGYALGRVAGLRARGAAGLDLGRYLPAQDDLLEGLRIAQSLGLQGEVLSCSVALTRLCLDRSDLAGAAQHGARGLEAATVRDPEHYLPLLRALLARAFARSRTDMAVSLLHAVEDSLGSLHTPRRLQVLLALAWGWLAVGDKARATDHAQELLRTPAARAFRMLSLEARALLASTTAGEEARRHKRIGAELAKEFVESLPITTSDEVRKRAIFRYLE